MTYSARAGAASAGVSQHGGNSREDADPFTTAIGVRSIGDGSYAAELSPEWAVGERPHGGYLLALAARAASNAGAVASQVGGIADGDGLHVPEPLSVSAQFLSAPQSGPALLNTEIRKSGRTVTVVRVLLEQRGRTCVEALVTLGRLPDDQPTWANLPEMSVNPPANAIDLAASSRSGPAGLSGVCDMRLDPATAGFLEGRTDGPLRLRMWVRPRSAQPDVLFALLAGDLTLPVTFQLGRFGWTPTVQLTALVRARPANGWLRLAVESRAVLGSWFDEDVTVLDSTGRLVCQARQLALTPAG